MTARERPAGDAWAIILAAGRGERFGGFKQFQRVAGARLVDHVTRTALDACAGVVVVVPAGHGWPAAGPIVVVEGGESRSASVRCGLSAVPSSAAIVVIHDAAHPLASPELFHRVVAAVRRGADAALPAVPLPDPVKLVRDAKVTATVPDDGLVWVQTPHAFRASLLRELHADLPEVREDTELIEAAGGTVAVVRGDAGNLHVTSECDLELVRRLWGEANRGRPSWDGCP